MGDEGKDIATIQEQIRTLFNNCQRLESDQKELESKVDGNHAQILAKIDEVRRDLANRLPTWATVVFGVLMALVGGLIGAGVMG